MNDEQIVEDLKTFIEGEEKKQRTARMRGSKNQKSTVVASILNRLGKDLGEGKEDENSED